MASNKEASSKDSSSKEDTGSSAMGITVGTHIAGTPDMVGQILQGITVAKLTLSHLLRHLYTI
jgi:hypothetical protein